MTFDEKVTADTIEIIFKVCDKIIYELKMLIEKKNTNRVDDTNNYYA